MSGGRVSLIWLVLVGVALALFAGFWLLPHLSRVTEMTEAVSRLENEGQRLSRQIQDLARELESRDDAQGQEGEAADPALAAAEARAREAQEKRLGEVRLLGETQDKLREATLTTDELRARLDQSETLLNRLREENKLLADSEADLKQRLERSARVVEAMRLELKGNSDRLVKLEARNRELRQRSADIEDSSTRTQKLVRELEGLYRRRDDLLTNIVRRYGEVADEYRSVALRINNPGQYGSREGVDLSRIQSALALADEDLREIDSLNSQASGIQKELTR